MSETFVLVVICMLFFIYCLDVDVYGLTSILLNILNTDLACFLVAEIQMYQSHISVFISHFTFVYCDE